MNDDETLYLNISFFHIMHYMDVNIKNWNVCFSIINIYWCILQIFQINDSWFTILTSFDNSWMLHLDVLNIMNRLWKTVLEHFRHDHHSLHYDEYQQLISRRCQVQYLLLHSSYLPSYCCQFKIFISHFICNLAYLTMPSNV